MRRKIVTKLWQGRFVTVRDYEVAYAIEDGGMEITYKDQSMYVSPDELKMLKPSQKIFKSKTGGKDYRLMDITFKPIAKDPRQTDLI